jgi:hypothetical protein
MKKWIALLCLLPLLAPGPWGIALNHQTQECGSYWPGDEYGSYELSPGWTAYYPERGVIETEVGKCDFDSDSPEESAERCCEELGYTFVEGKIGTARTSPLMTFFLVVFAIVGLSVLLAVLLLIGLVALLVVSAIVAFVIGIQARSHRP